MPEPDKIAHTFSVCAHIGSMGDRAANQAAHNKYLAKTVKEAMEKLPEWSQMSEAEQELYSIVVDASCCLHAICNVGAGISAEFLRCQNALEGKSWSDMANTTVSAYLDHLACDTDGDVTICTLCSVDTETLAAAPLLGTGSEYDFQQQSYSFEEFVENQRLQTFDQPEPARAATHDTILSTCMDCNLDFDEMMEKIEKLIEEESKDFTIESSLSHALAESTKSNSETSAFARQRSQTLCDKYLWESHKLCTLTTEYECHLGKFTSKYEREHLTRYSFSDYHRLIGSRYFITQINSAVGYCVKEHTEDMIGEYEDKQKPKLPRRKLATAVLDNQKDFMCLSQLRANAVFGHEMSWTMLSELKRVKTLEASTELIQKLDAQLQLWLEDVPAFIAGKSPLIATMEKERREAVHSKYMEGVREPHATDPLFQALVHRGLIQARKVLYQHKHEPLEGGRVAELGGDVKACISHMENNNDAMERLHGINNIVNSKYAKRGFRNAEGIGMAKAVDLTTAIEQGQISDKLILLAARMAARHQKKYGSQTAEKMMIDGKYKAEEDAILQQRLRYRAAKQAKMDEAEALMMLTDVDLIMKLKVRCVQFQCINNKTRFFLSR